MSFDWSNALSVDDYMSKWDNVSRIMSETTKLWSQTNSLKSTCNEMNEQLTSDIDDAQEYVLEIDDFQEEMEQLQNSTQDKVEEMQDRIKELQEKQKNGTITKSEQMELEIDAEYITDLNAEAQSKADTLGNVINSKMSSLNNIFNTQTTLSTEYANKTIEVSEEFRNTDHKGYTYYRTMNGKSVLQSYENLANEAVESATNLLNTVDIAKNSQNIFSNKNTNITLDINNSDLDSSGELNKKEKEETNV